VGIVPRLLLCKGEDGHKQIRKQIQVLELRERGKRERRLETF